MEQWSTRDLYRMFLESDFWKALSAKCKESAAGVCQECHRKLPLESHHTFYRENWFDTRVEDLKALCNACHELEHSIQKSTPKISRKKRFRKERKKAHRKESKIRALMNEPDSFEKLSVLRQHKLISHAEYRERVKPYLQQRNEDREKKKRNPNWWPGMYEGKLPGQVYSEIGTARN